jgi:hypothetical protein
MVWEKPEFSEVKMDAEIGSYQSDDRDESPVVVPAIVTNDDSGE